MCIGKVWIFIHIKILIYHFEDLHIGTYAFYLWPCDWAYHDTLQQTTAIKLTLIVLYHTASLMELCLCRMISEISQVSGSGI